MQVNINSIREKLSAPDFFKKWSQNIIGLYKDEQFSRLNTIRSQIFSDKAHENNDRKKIFYSLIKIFHPDSSKTHLKRFDQAVAFNDISILNFYRHLTSVKIDNSINFEKEDFNYEEYYAYQEEEYESWLFNEGENEDQGIIALLSKMYLGNSGKHLEPVDLQQIDGELILSDVKIRDLDGLQFCVGVTNLDLSHNNIEKIYEISYLKQLEELDLSSNEIYDIDLLEGLDSLEILYLGFNQIEDISVLLKLKELKFVSLPDNPLRDSDIILKLKENGVIVIDY